MGYSRTTIRSALLVALLGGPALADPVQVNVTVRDPSGNPVHGAGVVLYFDYFGDPTPPAAIMTDAAGHASITADAPDGPIVRGFIEVDAGLRDSDSVRDMATRWRELAQLWQFPRLGTPFAFAEGATEVAIDVVATPTVAVVGQARRGDDGVNAAFRIYSATPFFAGGRAEADGDFSIPTIRDSPVIAAMRDDWGILLSPQVPENADTVDVGVVQFDLTEGQLAGRVLSNLAPATPATLQVMRVDGAVTMVLFTNGDGRLDGDATAPGPDPDDPAAGIKLPAGEYVVYANGVASNDVWAHLAVHKAATQGVAAAELGALPHVTIPENGRATVTIDWDQLTAATRALVEAALLP